MLEFLAKTGIPTLPYPPYGSDIAPVVLLLFLKIKLYLNGTIYGGVNQIKEAVADATLESYRVKGSYIEYNITRNFICLFFIQKFP